MCSLFICSLCSFGFTDAQFLSILKHISWQRRGTSDIASFYFLMPVWPKCPLASSVSCESGLFCVDVLKMLGWFIFCPKGLVLTFFTMKSDNPVFWCD